MCRFLVVNTKEVLAPAAMLTDFAAACQNSPHWQGDGWGIAWQENGQWQSRKFLQPIWENRESFGSLPPSKLFLIHARGASFPKDKNNLDFNQPFLKDEQVFVFNGFLNGVELPEPIVGAVGSEKIFNLVLREGLIKAATLLIENSKFIEALNIGLATKKEISVFSHFTTIGDYHQLYNYEDLDRRLICSVPFGDWDWQKIDVDKVLNFPVFE